MDTTEKVGAYILVIGLFVYLVLNSLGEGGRDILGWIGWVLGGLIALLMIGIAWADRRGN